jgi:Ca2+-binding EF-hand superfamily protein
LAQAKFGIAITVIAAARLGKMAFPGGVPTGGPLHRKGITGAAFATDFSAGSGEKSSNQLFGGTSTNLLAEERRLIEKVFSIVDQDNSGTIDIKELEEMFKTFDIDTYHLSAAISRVMANVDKDHDGQISPQEFYRLLSQKFEKGDPRQDIENVYRRFDKKHDNMLDIDELYEVAQMLGENMSKKDIKEMIANLKILYEQRPKDYEQADGKIPKTVIRSPSQIREDQCFLTMDEFYHCMQTEL